MTICAGVPFTGYVVSATVTTEPAGALRIARRVVAAAERLGTYPFLGRTASWDARRRIRELPVANTPFVVMYAVDELDNAIVVLRVVHGARQRGSE